MLKKLCIIAIVLMCAFCTVAAEAGEAPATGRTWGYANLTTLLSPNWAFVLIGGHRYEYSRINDSYTSLGSFLWELYAGPVFVKKFGFLTLKLPLWYYYIGFDLRKHPEQDDYFQSHNFEFLPIMEYKYGKFLFIERTMFHSKFYCSNKFYNTNGEKWGYSLLIRQLLRVNYAVTSKIILTIADEIFMGTIEDEDTKSLNGGAYRGEPFYAKENLTKNRLYMGFIYKFTPSISLSPEYVYETNYKTEDKNKLQDRHHYFLMTFTYVLKLF